MLKSISYTFAISEKIKGGTFQGYTSCPDVLNQYNLRNSIANAVMNCLAFQYQFPILIMILFFLPLKTFHIIMNFK